MTYAGNSEGCLRFHRNMDVLLGGQSQLLVKQAEGQNPGLWGNRANVAARFALPMGLTALAGGGIPWLMSLFSGDKERRRQLQRLILPGLLAGAGLGIAGYHLGPQIVRDYSDAGSQRLGDFGKWLFGGKQNAPSPVLPSNQPYASPGNPDNPGKSAAAGDPPGSLFGNSLESLPGDLTRSVVNMAGLGALGAGAPWLASSLTRDPYRKKMLRGLILPGLALGAGGGMALHLYGPKPVKELLDYYNKPIATGLGATGLGAGSLLALSTLFG